ncbi:MAG: HlyC/CorC family transporter [Oscillospiraceae bacterium]|nr:HlyC/CorC family transporter [Oscillospiraceae bacterium]
MLGPIILQVVLIFLNAVFASAEIAVVSFNPAKLKVMADEGNRRAKRLVALKEIPAKFLATIQVAITLAGFLGSAYAADSFAGPLVNWLVSIGLTSIKVSVLNSIVVFLITLIIAYFSIVFGELVPKRIAMEKTEQFALGLSGLLYVVSRLFAPIVWLLTVSTNGVLRLLHIDPEEDSKVTEEDIRLMVSAGSEDGTIDEGENEIIQNVFEFNDISIDEICTHRVDVIGLDLEDDEAQWDKTIRENRHSFYPVYQESADDIVGVLNTKDYFRLDDFSRENVMEKAVEKPYLVPESMKANVLFQNMKRTGNYFAIAIEEYGGMSGIVTLRDLLEILVGELYDDEDKEEPDDIVARDGTWEIQGITDLGDVAKELDVELPVDDYDTFGGFICGVLGEVPEDGSTFELDAAGLHIRVLKVEDHRIETTLVTKKPVETEKEEEE